MATRAEGRPLDRPSRVTRQQWHLIRGEIVSLARFNDEPDDAGLPLY